MGSIGRFLGGSDEKSGNIAGVIAIAALLLLVGGFIAADDATRKDLLTAIVSIVTLALGYLFGRRSG